MIEYYKLEKADYEKAAANGICRSTADFRAYMLHWDKERTITQPPGKRIIEDDIIKLAKEHGTQYHTLRARIERGEDPVSAATRPPSSKQEKAALSAAARQKIDPEIAALAEEHGVKYGTLYYRIVKKGMDPVKAATEKTMTRSEIGQQSKAKRKGKTL